MSQPNILFLMCDQMQAQVLDPNHPCQTPNFDRLIASGTRFTRAYTPNAICSPARASLMTGLLPHSHNMIYVHHCQPPDANRLRRDRPHWAQQLQNAGYRTAYYGKWHVDHEETPGEFGWDIVGTTKGTIWQEAAAKCNSKEATYSLSKLADSPEGYRQHNFYGAHDIPPADRDMGIAHSLATDFLTEALADDQPWCCMVSINEPHDPFRTHQDALAKYNIDSLPLPESWQDPMTDKPGLYRKLAEAIGPASARELREASACYYASITEIDTLYGDLIDQIDRAGKRDNTIVILTSDHGELLGAHRLYCKNVGAFEEVYNIPLVMSGPGIPTGQTSDARVGLHELCPTIQDLVGLTPFDTNNESRSFTPVLAAPAQIDDWQVGYSEYSGGRYMTTQRIYWNGPWKLVHNGFDYDELYNLDDDPHELNNLADDPEHRQMLRQMFTEMWAKMEVCSDTSLLNAHYPAQRFAPFGPLTAAT